MSKDEPFTFAISLSVLDHLGRNLYRSFATVLGEAISNSWDADAENVWIYIDKEKGSFFIKDDGNGMNRKDFQDKFLKIGYSKRKEGKTSPLKGRPYIGRKGIGKLALLSCAERITVISKVSGGKYVGGVIDNSDLDNAITSDLAPEKYPLEPVDMNIFRKFIKNHRKGTIIYFEEMKEGIRNSLDYLRKLIALYFRFSLVDNSFKIHVDGKKITLEDLKGLAKDTEFLWNINGLDDPYVKKGLTYKKKNHETDTNLLEPAKPVKIDGDVKGFIASVRKPRNLKIMGTEEKVGVDLFVNGRLRERDILRRIRSARVTESYLYGQIHFNTLDDDVDRFSTSREDVVPDDKKFAGLLENLRKVLLANIFPDWDDWRRKHHKPGDSENPSITEKERKAEELFNEVSKEYEIDEDPAHRRKKKKVDKWVNELTEDARYNFPSYAECFISENLIRRHIKEKKIQLSKEAKKAVSTMKHNETRNKNLGNLSIKIRKSPVDTSYLSMDDLANLVDKRDHLKEACLSRDAKEYKPIRDAIAHTALLTDPAKTKLTTVFDNIKERVKTLLVSK
jgi:hypothetical protein